MDRRSACTERRVGRSGSTSIRAVSGNSVGGEERRKFDSLLKLSGLLDSGLERIW